MKKSRVSPIVKSLVMAILLVGSASCKDAASKSNSTEEAVVDVIRSEENGTVNLGGLALYTVRDAMGEDAKATLQAVADAGYQNIEAAGYADGKFYNMSPVDFKEYLMALGLNPISAHQGSVTLENADAMMADVKAAGFEYFVAESK